MQRLQPKRVVSPGGGVDHCSMRPPCFLASARQRLGFTFTELLVGLLCIALLVALVLASLAPAVRASRDAKCMAHLRQLHQATMAYVHDRGGLFPSYRPDHSSRHPTNPGVADYLGLRGAESYGPDDYRETPFTCPTIQAGEYRSARPYHMNIAINGRTTIGHGMAESLLIKRPTQVANPGRLMLFMEASYNESPGSTLRGRGRNFHTHVNWALVPKLVGPHRGSQHALFLDGHVAAVRPAEIPEGASQRDASFWSGL